MFRIVFNLLLTLLMLVVLAVGGVLAYLLPRLPSIDVLKEAQLQVPLRIYTHDHSLIAEFGEKRRAPVKLSQVPELLVKAVVAAEDDRFYEHPGVDWQAILRATFQLIRTGEKSQGGSTITMQVARNFFLSREKTYLRKLNEILLALVIERSLSKQEILDLYLNKIYFGHQAYGVAAAAEVYYGSELKDLSLSQIALIAGLPKAPSRINPITNPALAIKRRNYVLGRLWQRGYITEQSYQAAIRTADTARLHGRAIEVNAPYVAEMVRSYMVEHYGEGAYDAGYQVFTTVRDPLQLTAQSVLRKALINYDRRHGYRGPVHHYDLSKGAGEKEWQRLLGGFIPVGDLLPALVIHVADTSIIIYAAGIGLMPIKWSGLAWTRPFINENRRGLAPKQAKEIVRSGDVVYIEETAQGTWRLSQIPHVEGALVSLDPNDGAILALVGGFDFARSKFNRATQGKRQPGSSFKPFIYSAALESGFAATSLINDAPVVFDMPGLGGIWRPQNATHKYYGPTYLRDALAFSRNLVSIRLLQAVGINQAIRHAAKFGFGVEQLPPNLSLALGTGSVTPLELAVGYAVLANGGYHVEPYFVSRIEMHDGRVIMQHEPAKVCRACEEAEPEQLEAIDTEMTKPAGGGNYAKRVVSAQNIWAMQSMMQDVIRRGTGKAALVLGRTDLAGKTGTTNDHHDAWFSGFNTRLVTTTWVGFDDNRSLGRGETGGRAALPMWIDFMKVALKGMPKSILPKPPKDVMIAANPRSIMDGLDIGSLSKRPGADEPPANSTGDRDGRITEQLF
jgi:penicillin-binding protein 1A